MAKLISPARIPGRKNDFCSSLPKRMIVGPTVLSVTNGNGAPARCTSSKKMNWSVAGRPCPPYSWGQPIPSHPSVPICRTTSRNRGLPSPGSPSSARTSGVSSRAKYSRSSLRSACCSGVYSRNIERVLNLHLARGRPRRRRRGAPMPVIPSDYDSDPERWRSCDRNIQVFGDVHAPVARRIIAEDLAPVLDIGGGQGYLDSLLPTGCPSVVVDLSPTQLADAPHPKVRADASVLPVRDQCAGAVAALWMLYHLDDPASAVGEAVRVLRPGGLFVASTSSRANDP